MVILGVPFVLNDIGPAMLVDSNESPPAPFVEMRAFDPPGRAFIAAFQMCPHWRSDAGLHCSRASVRICYLLSSRSIE